MDPELLQRGNPIEAEGGHADPFDERNPRHGITSDWHVERSFGSHRIDMGLRRVEALESLAQA
jgi:hypothetical protein